MSLDLVHIHNPGTDTHKNLFRRIRRQLLPCPVINRLFQELVNQNLGEKNSIFGRLDNLHVRNLLEDIRQIISVDPDSMLRNILESGDPVEEDGDFIDTAYAVVLQRKPDREGKAFYLEKLCDGAKRVTIVEALAESDEYHQLRRALL